MKEVSELINRPQLHSAIQIRSNCIVQFTPPAVKNPDRPPLPHRKKNFSNKATYSGLVTVGVKKKIKRAIDIIQQITPDNFQYNIYGKVIKSPKLAFLTLTVPVDLNADQEKACYDLLLKPFIQFLTRQQGVRHYVFRVERTQSGRYHFHFIINRFLDKGRLNWGWNRILRDKGFLDSYFKNHGNYFAPSTDIISVKNSNMLAVYVAKYLAKTTDQSEAILMKVWGCSSILRGCAYFWLRDEVRLNAVILCRAPLSAYSFFQEYFNIINVNIRSFLNKFGYMFKSQYYEWCNALYNSRASA